MDSINNERKKQPSNDIKFLSDRQYLSQNSTEKKDGQIKKLTKKKVHFACQPSMTTSEIFEYTKNSHSEDVKQSKKLFFNHNDDDSTSESAIDMANTNLSLMHHRSIFTLRTIVIAFITIAFILIAAPIIIGIIVSLIKSSRNTTRITIQNSYISAFSITTTLTTGDYKNMNKRSQNISPCLSYTIINDSSRNIAETKVNGLCDNGLPFNSSNAGTWIRFVGSGGTTIPLSSPGRHHCSTDAAGWFNGILPKTVRTIVNGSICFASESDECLISLKSNVMYCIGDFYIYFLLPVSICNARYCTV